ncbi:hypothetical protein M2T75_37290, partial [Klebsiella pneumoniae]|nr:hypothetical protein [Klebsiella pneumoniae]
KTSQMTLNIPPRSTLSPCCRATTGPMQQAMRKYAVCFLGNQSRCRGLVYFFMHKKGSFTRSG